MMLEPLFEHCYSNHNNIAAISLKKVNAVFAELVQSQGLPTEEAGIWKKGFMGQSDDNYLLLDKIAEAQRAENRWNALTPEQKQAELAKRRAVAKEGHQRSCAMYESAYKMAYQAGDMKRAASAINAMQTVGCQ